MTKVDVRCKLLVEPAAGGIGDRSLARKIAEHVMIHLKLDNVNDFRTRDKLIMEVIEPCLKDISEKVAEVYQVATRHNHPGVNVGAHALANKVIEVLDR